MQKIIVVVGPTASGKSDLGVMLAKKYNGEIISADSLQVYRGLDIGSGKITKKEMRGIPHHCLDIADPRKVFTAANYVACARGAMKNILSRGKTPIIVGGTAFYIDVLLGRVTLAEVPPNPKLRKMLEKKTAAQLFTVLKKLNLKREKIIDQKNPRRLIRAIEIELYAKNRKLVFERVLSPKRAGSRSESAGLIPERVRWDEQGKQKDKFSILWLGIKRSPEDLKKRIHVRLKKRLPGIIREVKKLHKNEISWKRLYNLGLEYRWGSLYARGKISKEELQKNLETAIWHYAKRQMTWWKRNKKIHWISNSKSVTLK